MEKRDWWQTTTQVHRTLQQAQLNRLFFVGAVCAALGAVGMGIFRYYWIMAILIVALLSMLLALFLLMKGYISDETAGVIPMLVLCFVYTPAIWFTFDGLIGGTPFQAILFIIVILLSYYQKTQKILLTLYLSLLCGLTIHWFWRYHGTPPYPYALGTVGTFLLTVALTILLLQKSKERQMEISKEIIDQSNQDALTGLYNRSAITPILTRVEERYLKTKENFILLMLDIDDFKQINDTYGHTIGDAVLKSVAERLSSVVRERDAVSRYGGDEFLIVITIEHSDDANAIVERINASMCCVTGFAFDVSVSVGSAHRDECDAMDAVIALADQRMYEMKHRRAEARRRTSGESTDENATPKPDDARENKIEQKETGDHCMTVETFWQNFLEKTGRSAQTTYLECFHFDLNERSANELLALVLSGKKRATASSLYAFAPGEAPKPGNLSIVTDWDGNPRCVIETKAVQVIPFCEMTYEICSREGEDECLETWQAGHRRFFTEDGKEMGYEFTEDMPVIFEDFEVVYKI